MGLARKIRPQAAGKVTKKARDSDDSRASRRAAGWRLAACLATTGMMATIRATPNRPMGRGKSRKA